MQGKDNIEEFLSKRLEHLDSSTQPDWGAFEQKLTHAIYTKRMKRAIQLGTASVLLIFLFVGVNFYERFQEGFYTPRDHDVVLDEGLLEKPIATQPLQTIEVLSTKADPSAISSPEDVSTGTNQKSGFDASVAEGLSNNLASEPISKTVNSILKQASTKLSSKINSPKEVTTPAEQAIASNENLQPLVKESPAVIALLSEDQSTGDVADVSPITALQSNERKFKLENKLLNLSAIPTKALSIKTPNAIREFKTESTGPYISPLQENNSWSYSINVYPNFTFREFILDESKLNHVHRDFADAVESAEKGSFSMNLGFQISKRIGPVTYLNTGIEYISYRTEVAYDFDNFREANINKSNGLIEGYTFRDSADDVSTIFSDKNIYHYINFPLSIAYRPWASDHIRLNIEAGGSFMYFAGASGQTIDFKTLEPIDLSEREFKNTIGSLSFKVGVNYFVSKRINVGFEPTLMYFTNTIYTDDYPFEVIPYSVGLNFNLQFKLN